MKIKLFILIFLTAAFSLFAQQTTPEWIAVDGSDGLWTTAANWNGAVVPAGDSANVIINSADDLVCVLDDTASSRFMRLGNGDGSIGRLTIADGGDLMLSSQQWTGIGWANGTGILTVEEGGSITFGSHAWIGFNGTSEAIINMNGGTFNVQGMFGIGFGNVTGKGTIYLNSGVMNLNQWSPAQSMQGEALINIKAGSLVINGDQSTSINDNVTLGKIVGYSGEGEVVVVVADGKTTVTATIDLDSKVVAAEDDAEEKISDGEMDITSSDLELATDGADAQIVGVRVTLPIFNGAEIIAANIQFTAKAEVAGDVTLTIWGDASDNSAAISETAFDLSARAKTEASVTWNPAAWVAGEAGAAQMTPDLSSIIDEITSREGWVENSAITILISGEGAGMRNAYSGADANRGPVFNYAAKGGTPSEKIELAFDTELIFDGIDDYISIGNHDEINVNGTTLTLEAWVKASSWKDEVWQGCVINTEAAPNNGYMIRIGDDGTVNFNVGNEGWNEINTDSQVVSLDTWHHIAATFDSGVMTIYVDGVSAVTADNSASTTLVGAATTPTVIGNWGNVSNPGRSFAGGIYDVRIWNVARSAAQIMDDKDYKLTGIEDGLVGYWPLDEGTGQSVADQSGVSGGATLGSLPSPDINDPRWLGEVVIPPLDVNPTDFLVFDGTSQYADAGDDAALKLTGSELTLEALINMSEWRDQVWKGCIVNKEGAAQVGYMLRAGSDGILNFNIGSGTAWNEVNSDSGSLQLNQWHHVAGTYDGSVQKLYIDGNLVAELAGTFTIADTDQNLFIGSSAFNPDRTVNGSISDVRIWSIARTHQEIADGMNMVLVGDETGLIANWLLDEGEGQTIADGSPFEIAGQLGSTPEVDSNDPLWGPVTEARYPGGYMPEFPPTYFQGPFPFGHEPVRFDSPADKTVPTGDGLYHEYTAYTGTPNYDGDGGNLDEEVWNSIPWTLMSWDSESQNSYYNMDESNYPLSYTGPEDMTAWFKLLHDADHIFLAVMRIDDVHAYSDDAWDDTFYLWQCDAIQLQFDARPPGQGDAAMPQAEIGLGQIEGDDAYNYWEGGPGAPVINAQLELSPGSSQSSFEAVFGKALHTNVDAFQDSLVLTTYEATFDKWDEIKSDSDVDMMMTIIALDRDTAGVGRPSNFTVHEWGQGLFAKDRSGERYGSLRLSTETPTGVEDKGLDLPTSFALEQNYPNPFNPSTSIRYAIPQAANVKITIYNTLGQRVMTAVNARQSAGSYEINIDASHLSSGVYFYSLKAGDYSRTMKMMLLK